MAAQPATQPKSRSTVTGPPARVRLPRWRVWFLVVFAALLMGRVAVRLVEVQVVRHAELAAQARAEINRQITLQPQRGLITDRQGNVLAMDVERESLWVIPSLIPAERAPKLALTLSAVLGKDTQTILRALTDHDRYWTRLAPWLEPAVAARVAALEEDGLRLIYEPRRVYPQGSFAAQVVGAVNFNGDGISGVESFYDTALRGITGTLKAEFDPALNPIAIAARETLPARNGVNLKLTIDPLVQYIAESELKAAVEQHRADGGTIIIIEPQTGAVRAMASWPTFDPNRYGEFPAEVYGRNPAVSNVYEPGSTFKIITVAAGLQSRAFTADTTVNDTGVIDRYNETFHNWNYGGNGWLDPAGVLYHSSNVGALQFNELTGPENFYKSVQAFGFGAPTGVDLGGEEAGIVHPVGSPFYNEVNLITNSFGQAISVTPLQMVRAVAAIANDGRLMRPYIVEERCDGDRCTATQPEEVGQAVEQGVAWTIRRMLVHSANHYAPVVWAARTGSFDDQWLVPGFQVCAKTGTSSIPLPGGGYDPSYTIGSVVGFAPADHARYAVLVKIDRPKDDIWGVSTAIPVFYKIIDQLMRHERIAPDPALFSPGQE